MPEPHAPRTREPKTPAAAAPHTHTEKAAHDFAIAAARLLADDKCDQIAVLDVRKLSQVTDFIVIGSGTSERQMRSVLTHVEEMGEQNGFPPFRASDDERATWLLADFVDVVVHIFEPKTRAHYDLEMLWGDAPRVPWERPGQAARNRAGLKDDDQL